MTVGIPAYNRPDTLRRALESVCAQDYPNLEVIVSDDCSPSEEIQAVVDEFRTRIPAITFDRLNRNVGVIGNALRIRALASGDFFMWLADDDEISPTYVSALADALLQNPHAVTAIGTRVDLELPDRPLATHPSHFEQRSPLLRMLAFIWRTDDAFFYGLHRASAVSACSFSGFWWPNRDTAMNWCYVFLADLVLQGQVILVRNPGVQWINHNYTVKEYAVRRTGATAVVAFAIRRVNVHAQYQAKLARRLGRWTLFCGLPVSLASLIREFFDLLPQLPQRLRAEPRK